jgi:hypothetical protein
MSNELNTDLETWLNHWSAQIDEWEQTTGKDFLNGGKITLAIDYPLSMLSKLKPYATHLLTLGVGFAIGVLTF